MPNYNPALTRATWSGMKKVLADSTLATPFTTTACASGPTPESGVKPVSFFNTTPVAATIQVSNDDVDADYQDFNNVGAGMNAQMVINAPFFRALMAGAVASGTLIVTQ